MRERILIVVDDPVERRLLDQMVRQFGYEPAVAASGEAALAALTGTNGTRIDAVVLDLITPDLDGVGVLAKMCAAGLAVPVIVQTTDDGIDNVAAAMRAGATDFVVKPVGGERLRVALRNALAARALECELACVQKASLRAARISRKLACRRRHRRAAPGTVHRGSSRRAAHWRARAARRKRPYARACGHRSRGHPIRHRPLPRSDVRGRAAVAHRALDTLPQARFARARCRNLACESAFVAIR